MCMAHISSHTRRGRHGTLGTSIGTRQCTISRWRSMILATMICVRLRAYPYWYEAEDKNGSPCRSGGRKVFTI